MNKRRGIVSLLLFVSYLSFSSSALSQPETAIFPQAESLPVADGNIDLSEAVEAALQTHPSVRQADYLIEQRLAEERIVRAEGRPVIEYSLMPGYNPDSNRDALLQLNVTGRVPVYDFGQRRSRRTSAALRTERYRHLQTTTQESVAVELVDQYLKFALWRDALAAADLQIEQLRLIRSRINMRIAAGLADRSDLQRTDVSITRAEIQRNQASIQIEMAADRIRSLSQLSGEPVATLDNVAAVLMIAHVPEVESANEAPNVAAAWTDWQASEADVSAAQASRYPNISLGITNSSYWMDDRGPLNTGSSFDNRTQFGVFLTGRVSLGGGARHQIASAQAVSNAAQSAYNFEIMRFDMAASELQRRRLEAVARGQGSAQVVLVLEQARDLYWQEYILSKRRLSEVFDIEREIYQSRVEQLQARADEISVVAEQLGIQGKLVSTLQAYATGPAQ